jgi:hypothetical protein
MWPPSLRAAVRIDISHAVVQVYPFRLGYSARIRRAAGRAVVGEVRQGEAGRGGRGRGKQGQSLTGARSGRGEAGMGGRGRCQQGRGPAGRSGARPAWARSSRAAAGGLRKGATCSGRDGRGRGVLDDDRGYELAARDDKGLDKLCSATRAAALLWRLPFSLHLRHGLWTQGRSPQNSGCLLDNNSPRMGIGILDRPGRGKNTKLADTLRTMGKNRR